MNKFKPCRKCFNSVKKGFISTVIEGETVLTECECHIKWYKTQLLSIKLSDANIHSDFNLDFKDYKGSKSKSEILKLERFISNFKESDRSSSLYLYGDNGTQKTTIAYIIAKSLLEQELKVFYIPTMELITKNFGTFENQKTEKVKSFILKATESDLVIIDECFASQKAYSVSDYQINQLRSYLKNRLEVDKKSIIFISNIEVESIDKQGYSKTIKMLIKRNTLDGKTIFFQDYYTSNDFHLDEIFS